MMGMGLGLWLGLAPLVATTAACGNELCDDAQAICGEVDLGVEGDCPDRESECLASCIKDAEDCAEETLARCEDVCMPFVAEE